MKKIIAINRPLVGTEELDEIKKVIESGILTNPSVQGGPMVQRFEKGLETFVGVKNAVAVNSGTAALHASMLVADVGNEDEVIVPSFTYGATANVVLWAGAKPVFVDVDPETYNINPQLMEEKVTKKTKAIIPVHLFGLPAEMDAIFEIAQKHNLTVIEDCCQALGAEYKNRKIGSFGHFDCFSFYPGKVMTTGEGGAITTNDDELAKKLRMVRTHGQVKGYDFTVLGSNFRMTEIAAVIGCAQLEKLPRFLQKRRMNAKKLSENLKGVSSLMLPTEPKGFKHNYYLYTVKLGSKQRRDEVVKKLQKRGIDARVYYSTPVHLTPLYLRLGYGKEKLPVTEKIAKCVFSLPVNPSVTENDIEYMTENVKKSLGK